MAMKIPPNSVPMVGSPGPNGYITMGGMYTNLKVREDFGDLKPEEGKDFAYGGWYQNPPGTRAIAATEDELRRDLGRVPGPQRSEKSDAPQAPRLTFFHIDPAHAIEKLNRLALRTQRTQRFLGWMRIVPLHRWLIARLRSTKS